ncbi:MAG: lysoplasmalogenase, partial [Clostridia bacterium]|nr:lysoplasmalogenase [Clostridia bacterium]
LFAPFFNFDEAIMMIVCLVYALIISLMVGKTISNLITQKSLLNIVLVIGSILFFISDLMLLLNVFGGLPEITDILCLATYYPAQCFLAFSILVSSNIFKHNSNQKEGLNKE